MTEKTYSTGKFAKLIGITSRTLQRWDDDKKLVAHRTATGRRFYTETQYKEYMQIQPESNTKRKTVCYTRVSGNNQKKDLNNQIKALELFCAAQGKAVDDWLSDIGSGLNYRRKAFIQLMKDVDNGDISEIILAHKDRLVRFGFEWFETFCEVHDCKITVVNLQTLSPEEEVTQDLLTIIHCFSSRLYGLRRYKKEIQKMAFEIKPETAN
ncbi:MAG: IS607 family transposase [Methylobacter sp.]|nr:IS607 family transposase [Methylobacter sp.]